MPRDQMREVAVQRRRAWGLLGAGLLSFAVALGSRWRASRESRRP